MTCVMRPPIFLFGLARKERQRGALWKKEKGASKWYTVLRLPSAEGFAYARAAIWADR